MENKVLFGAFLQGIIKSSGHTQDVAAKHLDIPIEELRDILQGCKAPSLEQLGNLMRSCNCQTEIVIKGKNLNGDDISMSFEI